jgi:hypothetical protein
VAERELVLVRERRGFVREHELFHPKASECLAHLGDALTGELGDRADPEHTPDHGRVLECRLLVLGQAVQARGDQPMDRTRELHVSDAPRDLPP